MTGRDCWIIARLRSFLYRWNFRVRWHSRSHTNKPRPSPIFQCQRSGEFNLIKRFFLVILPVVYRWGQTSSTVRSQVNTWSKAYRCSCRFVVIRLSTSLPYTHLAFIYLFSNLFGKKMSSCHATFWLAVCLMVTASAWPLDEEVRGVNLLSALRVGHPRLSFTRSTSIVTETYISTVLLPSAVCARFVNITGPCRRFSQEGRVIQMEEPVVLTFDEDMDDADALTHFNPTMTLKYLLIFLYFNWFNFELFVLNDTE